MIWLTGLKHGCGPSVCGPEVARFLGHVFASSVSHSHGVVLSAGPSRTGPGCSAVAEMKGHVAGLIISRLQARVGAPCFEVAARQGQMFQKMAALFLCCAAYRFRSMILHAAEQHLRCNQFSNFCFSTHPVQHMSPGILLPSAPLSHLASPRPRLVASSCSPAFTCRAQSNTPASQEARGR